jgi:hypothetical protein
VVAEPGLELEDEPELADPVEPPRRVADPVELEPGGRRRAWSSADDPWAGRAAGGVDRGSAERGVALAVEPEEPVAGGPVLAGPCDEVEEDEAEDPRRTA